MAWDLSGTDFGSRQALYERFFNGDVVRLRMGRFQTFDYSRALAAVDRLIDHADTAEREETSESQAGWSATNRIKAVQQRNTGG